MKRLILPALLVLFCAEGGRAFSIQDLGSLPGGSYFSPTAISADGSVVVGSAADNGFFEAARWTATGGTVSLGDLPGSNLASSGFAVSSDGSVVVGVGESAESGTHGEAFRWTSDGGMIGLGDLPTGVFNSTAFGVSADGSVVVGYGTKSNGVSAFRWTSAGGMTDLGDLPGGTGSKALGVSADGSVIVGAANGSGEAFRWTNAGGMVGLGHLPGGTSFSQASAVSANGAVTVGFSSIDGGFEAFRWTSSDGMVGLGFVQGDAMNSEANAVSADGSVIVGINDMGGDNFEAAIWTSGGGMQSLSAVLTNTCGVDLTGWSLRGATGISADGTTIVGYGLHNGIEAGWIVTIPESDADGTMISTLALLLVIVRKRRSLKSLLSTSS